MNSLEQYLQSVKRSLDVRNKAEQEEIVVEIRDHILTLAEQLEAEGQEPEQAIEEAIARMGDSLLVASRVSESHDGGSWRQAWVAVIPIGFTAISAIMAAVLRTTEAKWYFLAGELLLVMPLYLYFSARIPGRRWRMTWLASIVGCALFLSVLLCYVILMPSSLRTTNPSLGSPSQVLLFDTSDSGPLGKWRTGFFEWTVAGTIGGMALLTAGLLLRRRRWSLAVAILLPLAFPVAAALTPGMDTDPWWLILGSLLYGCFLLLSLLYLLIVEEWNGDWTMTWCFCLAFTQPVAELLPDGRWADVFNMLVPVALVAATILIYTALPRKHAFAVFFLGTVAGALLQTVGPFVFRRAQIINPGDVLQFLVVYAFMEYCTRRSQKSQQPSLPFDLPLGYQ